MIQMELYNSFNLKEKEVISIVGGGGKTTTLFMLADELKKLGKRVLVTTTTAIFNPKEEEYDHYFLGKIDDFTPNKGSITILGDRVEKGKLKAASLGEIERIVGEGLFDYLLIEADGAKGKPIKAPDSYEPVIPKSTTKTIGVIGLDSLDRRVEDIVHRPERFIQITKTQYPDIIDVEIMVNLILHPRGLFKGARGERILLLNKACNEYYALKGKEIRRALFKKGFKGRILLADIRTKKFY